MLGSKEIRQKYLEFFGKRGHVIIPSASLIPENDPTLLFTNSGMFPLVPYLLGETHPGGKRLTDSQKCFRMEDIEEVGDNRHNTFFEMLGNWSLGDYFKKDQLNWWYEFLVEELHVDINRLYQTVYLGDNNIPKDEESISILKDIFKKYGIDAEVGPDTSGKGALGPGVSVNFPDVRIMAYRDKNWWKRGEAIGELGGPDSETFYDTGKPHDEKFGEHCHLNCDCGRFLEIGNSVFMQYRKTEAGWEELKNKNVDFGGGLERVLMVVNGLSNIFESDLFLPVISEIERLSGKKYKDDTRSFEIVADHIKAATFIMGDDQGVSPSNTGQGYIVRRLIRRAIRFGKNLDIVESGWTKGISEKAISIYKDIYPELTRNQKFIFDELDKEEEKFAKSLEKGIKEFEMRIGHSQTLSGKDAFDLYQSYGFPIEMTLELASERGFSVDRIGFDEELKNHQELSRTASAGMFKGGLGGHSEKELGLHTATHLLQAALRKILGDHIYQKGSNITPERLRFDFSHPEKISEDDLKKIEGLVNDWIKSALPVSMEEMTVSEAKEKGALGVFDERYGEKVKVYTIGGDNPVSMEICGGPHISNTSELQNFKIIKEEAVSSGVRRIKADIMF